MEVQRDQVHYGVVLESELRSDPLPMALSLQPSTSLRWAAQMSFVFAWFYFTMVLSLQHFPLMIQTWRLSPGSSQADLPHRWHQPGHLNWAQSVWLGQCQSV